MRGNKTDRSTLCVVRIHMKLILHAVACFSRYEVEIAHMGVDRRAHEWIQVLSAAPKRLGSHFFKSVLKRVPIKTLKHQSPVACCNHSSYSYHLCCLCCAMDGSGLCIVHHLLIMHSFKGTITRILWSLIQENKLRPFIYIFRVQSFAIKVQRFSSSHNSVFLVTPESN